jgi:hypothetical protein
MIVPGTGFSQTFSFSYYDMNGFTSIVSASALFENPFASAAPGRCDVYFRPASGDLWLMNDAGTGWLGPIALGQTGSLENGQCTVDGAASSSLGIGNYLVLHLALSFKPAFAGFAWVSQEAYDGSLDSGWHLMGLVSLPSSCPTPCPASDLISITPSAGSGIVQTFSLAYTTPIISASVAFYQTKLKVGSCLVYYNDASNALWLMNDAGTSWLGPVGLGQTGSLQNNQCLVDGRGSSRSGSGDSRTLNVALTFQPSFAGVKSIALEKFDGIRDSWGGGGIWTVALPGDPPTGVFSGGGSCCGLSLTYTDPDGASTIFSASALINSSFSTTRACYVYFRPASGHLWLMNDSGSAWLGPITLGQTGGLQNSQCLLDGAISSAVQTGSALQLSLGLFFDPSFTEPKSIFLEAYDGKQDSGWSKGVSF